MKFDARLASVVSAMLLGALVAPVFAATTNTTPAAKTTTTTTTPPASVPAVTTTSPVTTPAAAPTQQLQGTVQTIVQPVVQPVTQPVVQQTQAVAPSAPVKKIAVMPREVPLQNYSSGRYKAVEYTITNNSGGHMEILQGDVQGGLNEQMLAAEKAQKANGKRRMAGLGLGLASGAMIFIPYGGGLGSIGAYRAAAIGSNVLSHGASAVNQSGDVTAQATGLYQTQIRNVLLSHNQTYTFRTAMPKETAPHIHLVVRNLTTNQIEDVVD